MGIRLTVGAGYGILVTKKQIKACGGIGGIEKAMAMYFGDRIQKAYDITRKSRDEIFSGKSSDELDEITNLLLYQKYIDVEESEMEKKLVIKDGGAEHCFRDQFIYPAEEYGTKSFLGFINAPVHDSDVMYAMLHALGKLGVKCDTGQPFEYHVPVMGDDTPLSIPNDGSEIPLRKSDPDDMKNWPKFVPSPRLLFTSGLGKDYANLVKSTIDGPVPFQTRDACDEYVSTWIKEWSGITSVHYRRGLELVQVIFPGTRMKDIERYIVGWWA